MRKIIPVLFLLFCFNINTYAQVIFTPEDVDVPCDATSFCVDINVTNFISVAGLQISLQWDTAAMTLLPGGNTDFLPNPNVIYSDSSSIGKLGVSWLSFSGVDINDGDPVFQLCFAPNNTVSGTVFLGPPLNGGQVEVTTETGGVFNQFAPYEFQIGTVTYSNNQIPSIDCPNDTTVFSAGIVNNIDYTNVNDGCVASDITYTLNGATTGSGTDHASGEFFNTGMTTVTYIATDNGGNSGTCSFVVTADNTTPPPSDTFLQIIPQVTLDCNNDQVTVEVIALDFIDMLSMQFGVFWDTTALQLTNVTADLSGANPPFYNGPDNKVFFSWPSGGTPVTQPDSTLILTFTFDLVGAFSLPALTFGDYSGPAVTELTDVESGVMVAGVDYEFSPNVLANVLDNTPPDFGTTCPTNMTIYTPVDSCTAVPNFTAPTATDACDANLDYTNSHNPTNQFSVGPTTVTYTATDDAGNTSTCSFTVTVQDTIAPTLTCPTVTTFTCPSDVSGLAPTTSDACGLVDVTYTIGTTISGDDDASNETFPYGTTTVLYIATDVNGNSSSCTFTVTVEDTEVPILNCPANPTFACPADVSGLAPTASDPCGTVAVTYTIGTTISGSDDASGETFPFGTTIVIYTATDESDNTSSCSFTVTVEDTEAPIITCPPAVTEILTGADCVASATVLAPTASDNCGNIILTTYEINGTLDTLASSATDFTADFPAGMTTVTYTTYATNGQSATCDVIVTVADMSVPILTCPLDSITITLNGGSIDTILTNIAATATDNCPGTPTLTYALQGVSTTPGPSTSDASGTTFNIGETTVTYFAEDANGQIASCSFVVTIEAPSNLDISCPALVPIEDADAPFCSDTVQNIDLTINSNEADVASITFTLTGATTGADTLDASGTIFNVGTTVVTYFVTDIFGRDASCSFEVVIVDNINPEISCPTLDAFPTDANACVATISLGLVLPGSATDNCGIDSISYSLSGTGISSGSGLVPGVPTVYPIGTTTITYIAYDESGNTESCTVDVVVVDTQGPVIDCPTDVNIEIPMGATDTVLTNLGLVSAIDACGTVVDTSYVTTGAITVTSTNNDISGLAFPIGTTIVTYTTIDNNNNITTCSFSVTVTEEGAMSLINCPADMDVCNPLVTAPPIYLVDPATIVTLSYGTNDPTVPSAPGELTNVMLPTGPTVITYSAEDLSGNMETCSFVINVDDIDPNFTNCPPAPISFNTAIGECTALADWTIPTPTDNCGIESITASHTPPIDLPVGANEIMYTATDSAGNTTSCVFTVIILDSEAPTWDIGTCPPTDVVLTPTGGANCESVATWTPPTATDACSINIIYTSSHMSGDTFSMSDVVVFTATDESGNTAICTLEIAVEDNQPPSFVNCPALPIFQTSEQDSCGAFVSWPFITATDDCGMDVAIDSSHQSGGYFPVGTTTVEYTATDAGGNTVTCSFDVMVVDTEGPSVACPDNVVIDLGGNIIDPSGIIISVVPNTSCDSVVVNFTEPAFTDNCSAPTVVPGGIVSGSTLGEGTHTVTYTATDNSNNTTTCSFTINVSPFGGEIEILASPNDTICEGNITLSVVDGGAGAIYSWAGPASWTSTDDEPILPPFSGNYSVTCTLPGGCSATDNIDITFGTIPAISATNDGPICGSGDLQMTLEGAPLGATILWTAPNAETFSTEDPLITTPGNEYSGIWTVTVSNGICDATTTTEVIVGVLPDVTANSDCNGAICLGETCTIIGQEVAGTSVTYNWSSSPANCLPAGILGSTFDFTPTEAGDCTFYYSVSAGNCTSAIDSVVISVSGTPVTVLDEFTIEPTDSITNVSLIINDIFNVGLPFEVSLVTPAGNIQGTVVVNSGGTMSYNPNGFAGVASFVYELCVNCDSELCTTGIVNINVVDESCRVPNIITPNNDGMNELLIINCLETTPFPNAEMQIFNQWGDEVFYAKPYTNNWDGTFDGNGNSDLPDGTYFYIFKLDSNAEVDKGHITLFR
ncbi:MAG: gliding motility-associated-like protein [Flavobacteriales bacterium]|jgi:gliding motility-associated-like protein